MTEAEAKRIRRLRRAVKIMTRSYGEDVIRETVGSDGNTSWSASLRWSDIRCALRLADPDEGERQ